jgi:hypothetical protein
VEAQIDVLLRECAEGHLRLFEDEAPDVVLAESAVGYRFRVLRPEQHQRLRINVVLIEVDIVVAVVRMVPAIIRNMPSGVMLQ